MTWLVIYALPGFGLIAWGWRDMREAWDGHSYAAVLAALVGVVLTWPVGFVVRLKNTRARKRFALAAGTRSAETRSKARAEGCQSDPAEQGNAQLSHPSSGNQS